MTHSKSLLAPALCLAGAVFFTGCGCEKRAQSPVAAQSAAAHYKVRGIIDALPDPKRVGEEDLQIHHERIPDFKDKSGKVVGMNEMVMGFPTAPSLTLPALKVGDKVEFEFEVVWSGSTPYYLTAVRTLDPKTQLTLTK